MQAVVRRTSMVRVVLGLSVFALLVSCAPNSYESRGNSSYAKAVKATGDEKRRLEKEAYTYYRKAVKRFPDRSRISIRLLNRYIEMTLKRGNLILEEANANMEALELFVMDIDSVF